MPNKTVLTSTTDDANAVTAALEHYSAEPEEAESETEGEEAEAATEEEAEADAEADAEAEVAEEEKPKPKAKPKPSDIPEVRALETRLKRANFEAFRAMDMVAEQRAVNQSLLERLAALEKGGKAGAEPEEEEIPAFKEAAPSIEDADSIEKWMTDYAAWVERKTLFMVSAEQEIKGKKAGQTTAAAQAAKETEEVNAAHAARINAYRETDPEFDEVLQSAQEANVPLTQAMLVPITRSDYGPQILKYLGQNPKVATELSKLPMGPLLVRIGRIEAKFEKEEPTTDTATGDDAEDDDAEEQDDVRARVLAARRPPATATDRNKKPLPKPPAKIAGTGGKNTKDPSKMNFKEYKAWRAAGGGR